MKLVGIASFMFVGMWTLSSSALANESEAFCQDRVERRGSIQVQQIASRNNTICYVSVRNFKATGLFYRDYMFTSDGELMVFNSLGPGSESETTGAREFFMFPRVSSIPTFEWNDENRRLIITTVNGNRASFDYEDAELVEMSGATIKRSAEIRPDNKGGVEILNYQGLLLDVGFKLGSAPSQNSRALSKLIDINGKTCQIQNDEIFKYSEDQDVYLRYSDQGLKTFLKKRCPQLLF